MKLRRTVAALCIVLAGCASQRVGVPDQVLLNGSRLFPESLTSLRDGTLIIGSIGEGAVFRWRPGEKQAERWIQPGTDGLLSPFGVWADERTHRLWLCSNEAPNSPIKAAAGEATSAVYVFDLRTGGVLGRLPFPQDPRSLCNDITTGKDGTAYITDTRNARIFRVKPGATALEIWLQGERLQGGVDGIVLNDPHTMYVNLISAGRLLRITLNTDGSAGEIANIETSRPLQHPDGMRRIGANQLLLVEGSAGTADLVTISGEHADIRTLRGGFVTPSGITGVGPDAWVVEGKFAFRDPKMQGQDPGAFYATRVPWK
jgi:sugar lactone lactonase YvrE